MANRKKKERGKHISLVATLLALVIISLFLTLAFNSSENVLTGAAIGLQEIAVNEENEIVVETEPGSLGTQDMISIHEGAPSTTRLWSNADAHVYAVLSTTNFGPEEQMLMRQNSIWASRSYIRFVNSLSETVNVVNASFCWYKQSDVGGIRDYRLHWVNGTFIEGNGGTDDSPSGEATWNNQPCTSTIPINTTLCPYISSNETGSENSYYCWDATELVNKSLFEGSNFTLVVATSEAGSVGNDAFTSAEHVNPNYWPTLDIAYTSSVPPTTTLVSPVADYSNDTAALTNITFECNATENIQLVNISLYFTNSSNESFTFNQSTNTSGTSNSSNWILELGVGNYTWNCLAYDNSSLSDWGTNRSLILNYTSDPSTCGTITENTTLVNNLSSSATCITFGASDIILDCAGYNIDYATGGAAGYGIYSAGGYDNIITKNCHITEGHTAGVPNKQAMYFVSGENILVENNTIETGSTFATAISFGSGSNGAIVRGNIITALSSSGVSISSSQELTIYNNTLITIGTAISLSASTGANITNNSLPSSDNGVYLGSGSNNSIIYGNYINAGNNEGLYIYQTYNVSVYDNYISALDKGVYLRGSYYNNFNNNTIIGGGNEMGFYSYLSHYNNITNCTIQGLGNAVEGLYFSDSNNSRVIGNQIYTNDDTDVITITTSYDNIFDTNNVSNDHNEGSGYYTLRINSGEYNQFVNNNFSCSFSNCQEITDLADMEYDVYVYNNSFGQIKWNQTDLDASIVIKVGQSIFLENNTVGISDIATWFNFNGSAELKFFGLNATAHWLLKNGVRCDNSSACNITYDSGGSVIADVSSFSNYSTQEENGPPNWSNNQTDIVSTYSNETLSYFNITWEDDNSVSTVYFESNYSGTAQNYSMNNITSIVYNYSVVLPAGSYYWKSYANDSSDQWNETDSWGFMIAQAGSEVNLTLNNSESNISLIAGQTIDLNCTLIFGEEYIYLYNNGTLINSGISPLSNSTNFTSEGLFNITCLHQSTQNYSTSLQTYWVNVSATIDYFPNWSNNQTDIVNTYSNETLSYFNITWEDDNSVSTVYFESNYSGTAQNYSMNNITSIVYNYSVVLPAGSYYWKSYANDSSDQWNETDSWNFVIAEDSSNCDVGFNETSSLIYLGTFKAFTNCTSEFTLSRNGTTLINNSDQELAAGNYNFTVIRVDQNNYSNYYDDETFVVSPASTSINLTVNNSKTNYTVDSGDNLTVNCSLMSGPGPISLYLDGVLINSGDNNISNVTTFTSVGTYNLTCLHQSSQNYSASSESYFVTISAETPETLPSGGSSSGGGGSSGGGEEAIVIICSLDSECGEKELIKDNYCYGNLIHRKYSVPICLNPGEVTSTCSEDIVEELIEECDYLCEKGNCIEEIMPGPGKLPLVGGAIALAPESNFWWLLLLLLSLIILILIYIKIRLDRSRLDPLERKVRKRLLKGKTTSKIREEFIGKRWSEADLKTVFWRIDAANQLIEYYPLTWGTLKQLKRFVYLSSKEGLAKEWIIRSLVHGGWNETLIEYFVSAHYELLV